jgi:hypothetical protein
LIKPLTTKDFEVISDSAACTSASTRLAPCIKGSSPLRSARAFCARTLKKSKRPVLLKIRDVA